ncbi:hypothetical protein MTR67_045286 [Solanum verrucosum]|uniref:Uncharacterized protein n=1 Tax=Solanum verrucosum TaxID=315347 RepID=A0AAF0ZUF9_SOLVR|nr:hypothetical protein MTR67_045286 [Solanum verrucosum]
MINNQDLGFFATFLGIFVLCWWLLIIV